MHISRTAPPASRAALLVLLLAFTAVSHAQDKKPAPPSASRVIYDAWYTVTRQDPGQPAVRYQFYNDRMELKNGRMAFQNHLWKKEDDMTVEERIGAFAEFTGSLTPQFFNFKSVYQTSETTIDGTFAPSKAPGAAMAFTAKIRRNGSDLTPVAKSVPPRTILSTFFATWLSTQFAKWKVGETRAFSAILENDLENQFQPQPGVARLESPDDTAKKLAAQKITLQFTGQSSTWWVDRLGVPYRIEFPSIYTTVERTTEAKAKAFFQ